MKTNETKQEKKACQGCYKTYPNTLEFFPNGKAAHGLATSCVFCQELNREVRTMRSKPKKRKAPRGLIITDPDGFCNWNEDAIYC